MAYGASQIVFDSTRYDSLYMRTNGFISIVQILGAVGLVLSIVVFSVRLVKALRFKWWFIPIWIGMLALIGVAGYMEYYVQRHGHLFVFAYNTMSGCLLGAIALTVVVYCLTVHRERKIMTPAGVA
jgi:riboflavin transporter FmnP